MSRPKAPLEPHKGRVGRPTKFCREIAENICNLIADACYYKTRAAREAGIDSDTLTAWERKYPDFSASIKKAEEDRKDSILTRISLHGATDWKALAWLLERKYPAEFSLHNRIEFQGKLELSTEELREHVKRVGLTKILTPQELEEEAVRAESSLDDANSGNPPTTR